MSESEREEYTQDKVHWEDEAQARRLSGAAASAKTERKFPVPVYRNDAGELCYDAPHEPRELFTLRIKSDGVFFSLQCDQEPGIYLCGTSLEEVAPNFAKVIAKMRELDAAITK